MHAAGACAYLYDQMTTPEACATADGHLLLTNTSSWETVPKTVFGHSTPRITRRLERQFTSGLMSVKDQEESFCTHQSACELSLWSLSYCSSKIDIGNQGGELSLGTVPTLR